MIDSITSVLKVASSYQISEINISPFLDEARIYFTRGPSHPDFSIELFGVFFYKISKTPGDDEGCFIVGEMKLTEYNDEGREILESLNYGIYSKSNTGKAYHLKIDGDIVCDIVFRTFKLMAEVEKN